MHQALVLKALVHPQKLFHLQQLLFRHHHRPWAGRFVGERRESDQSLGLFPPCLQGRHRCLHYSPRPGIVQVLMLALVQATRFVLMQVLKPALELPPGLKVHWPKHCRYFVELAAVLFSSMNRRKN